MLKPRNVISMLAAGARDFGFAGADWIYEMGVDIHEVLDTQLNPVQLVVAAPHEVLIDGALPKRHLVVASEYPKMAADWIKENNLDAEVLTTYGATEVFPPEDADLIIDNTATGSTLRANGLVIIDVRSDEERDQKTADRRFRHADRRRPTSAEACDDGPQRGQREFGRCTELLAQYAAANCFAALGYRLVCSAFCRPEKRIDRDHSKAEKLWRS